MRVCSFGILPLPSTPVLKLWLNGVSLAVDSMLLRTTRMRGQSIRLKCEEYAHKVVRVRSARRQNRE